jgi:hypothetical protein
MCPKQHLPPKAAVGIKLSNPHEPLAHKSSMNVMTITIWGLFTGSQELQTHTSLELSASGLNYVEAQNIAPQAWHLNTQS